MRLKDADAILEKLARMIGYCETNKMEKELTVLFQVGDAIMDCPTIDAVPVVRCKDCKKASIRKYSFNGEVYSVQCNIRSLYMNENDFCSCAERKE